MVEVHNYGFSLSMALSKDRIKMIRKIQGVITETST